LISQTLNDKNQLEKNDDSIVKQTLQRTSKGHGQKERPKNKTGKDLANGMWTVGFK